MATGPTTISDSRKYFRIFLLQVIFYSWENICCLLDNQFSYLSRVLLMYRGSLVPGVPTISQATGQRGEELPHKFTRHFLSNAVTVRAEVVPVNIIKLQLEFQL